MPTLDELTAQIERMASELDRRTAYTCRLDAYYDGKHPAPDAITASKAQKAYQRLLDLADTNWPQLIVDSVEERLEVQAIKLGTDALDKRAWEIWQANGLDAESSLVHQSALTAGRAFVIVWPGENGDPPSVTPEHASTCIVEYATGSRRIRVAGLRRWWEGDDQFATLYLPDGTYKFQATKANTGRRAAVGGWEKRIVPADKGAWPLPNQFGGRVQMVEVAVNRRLRPNPFGVAYGEFETNTGHIDRINYAMFSQIVAMTWSGFPLRYKIGDPVAYEDDGETPLKPFDVQADSVVLIENPQGKLGQLPEASLENYGLTIDRYVEQLAALTKTPAHYLLGKLVNVSADAIRAAEAGLVSKVRRHHRSLGEAWEDVARLMLIADGKDLTGTPAASAEVVWKDPESRSMAERADAASKLKDILPWQALAAKVLQASPQEVSKWEADRAVEQLLAPAPPAPAPAPAPAA